MSETVESNLISANAAQEPLGREDVSFVDASWYLPAQGRNGLEEFKTMRIPGAVFFDIDQIADQEIDLPHMLPTPDAFARAVSLLGISHENLIIVYDGPGLMSSARVWWTFKIMGAQDVRVLKGGFDRWKENGHPVETGNPNPPIARIFQPSFDEMKVASEAELQKASKKPDTTVLDARSQARFFGKAEEPRPGLRSGHIPNSKSLPFTDIVKDGGFVPIDELKKQFKDLGIDPGTEVITTCGSGVTAAILSLALEEIGNTNHRLYDGSWAEWGRADGPEISTKD